MSALNVIVKTHEVHLITDAAAYDPDGTLRLIGPKVAPMPHLGCALAIRGPASAVPLLAAFLGYAATSFDELEANVVDLLKEAAAIYAPVFAQNDHGPDFETVVAGFDDTGKPRAYFVASHDRYQTEPWSVVPLAGFVPLPCDGRLLQQIQSTLPADVEAIDPTRDGIAVAELQRRIGPELSSPGYVGGFVQLTTITLEQIVSRVIHRWPDVVGCSLKQR